MGKEQKYTNVGESIKEAMSARGYTQAMLGCELYKLGDLKDKKVKAYAQSSAAERLRKANMNVGTLIEILDVLKYDLMIVDRNKQSKNEWKIRNITEEEFNAGKRPRVKKTTEAE